MRGLGGGERRRDINKLRRLRRRLSTHHSLLLPLSLLPPHLFTAGAELFESLLIDHDEGVNFCNWCYFSGIGNDPRDCVFKTVTQVRWKWRTEPRVMAM